MIMNIIIKNNLSPINNQEFEIVERKGLGHPDTVADGIAEAISLEYSMYCLEKFGAVLHHNVDKITILGGLCEVGFGIGQMMKPINLILNGRMSNRFGDTEIDIEQIQITAAKNYLRKILPKLDLEKWLKIHPFVSSSSRVPFWFNPRSIEDLPDFKNPHANDTATVVGFWPLSTTEKLVLESEKFFYNDDLTPKFNFIGQDIKIMAVRKNNAVELTMCVPFFANEIGTRDIYESKLRFLKEELLDHIRSKFGKFINIDLYINTQDQRVKDRNTAKGHYFVVSGSALDFGEEGIAGRGNRSRGLISSMRPYSIEAACGKNPIYHVGKVYTYIANLLAQEISNKLQCDVNIIITSRNGDPLSEPQNIIVNISTDGNQEEIREIVNRELRKKSWFKEIVEGGVFLPINDFNSLP